MAIVISENLGENGFQVESIHTGVHRYIVQGPIGKPPIYVIKRDGEPIDYRHSSEDALVRAHEWAIDYAKSSVKRFSLDEKNLKIIDRTGLEEKLSP